MTYYDQENQFLRQRLQKEIPIFDSINSEILYQELDPGNFILNGAKNTGTFGFETDSLGSYTRQSAHEKEHFHFSLLFVAYGVNNPLSKKRTVSIYSSMNMRITCSTICGYLRSINGRLEHMEVRGNIVVLL